MRFSYRLYCFVLFVYFLCCSFRVTELFCAFSGCPSENDRKSVCGGRGIHRAHGLTVVIITRLLHHRPHSEIRRILGTLRYSLATWTNTFGRKNILGHIRFRRNAYGIIMDTAFRSQNGLHQKHLNPTVSFPRSVSTTRSGVNRKRILHVHTIRFFSVEPESIRTTRFNSV